MTDPRITFTIHIRPHVLRFTETMQRLARVARAAGVALEAWQLALVERQLRWDCAKHGHVMVRGGRRMHHDMVRPPRLCIDGRAYRNRTRRRTRRNRR